MKLFIRSSCVLVAAAAASTAFAQDAKPEAQKGAAPAEPSGSSDDLNAAIDSVNKRPAGILPNGPVSIVDDFFDKTNKKLDESIRLKFGMAYTAVWQRASEGDDPDALGGDFDLFARWRAIGNEKDRMRSVVGVYTEYRHDMSSQSPRELGSQFGSLWGTTNNFDTHNFAFTQLWWEQHLLNDKLVITAGKLDATNYYNKYRYQDDATAFLSQAFSGNPARAFPDNGLGANGIYKIGDAMYVSAGFQDANGSKMESGLSTIDNGDWFIAGEFGWTPTFDKMGKGNYSVTLWHIDEGDVTGRPSDEGIAFSCEQEVGKRLVPFFRAAFSDGDATGVDEFVAVGLGVEGELRAKEDLDGVALAWGSPNFSALDDQWTFEIFHRFQLSPAMQFTVGYQYYIDPSFRGPFRDDHVGVFELRLRVAF